MALETVVYPQDPFGHCVNKEFYYSSLVGGSANWDQDELGLELEEQEEECLYGVIDNNNNMDQGVHQNHHPPYHQPNNWDASTSPPLMQNVSNNNNSKTWDPSSSNSPDDTCTNHQLAATTTGGRRKRRRSKSSKNKEEIENQRMTHIAVERNRRKQMNEYLAVLRSLMPSSYSQRGDQASIIGGAINFVKELEQLLQSMEAQKGTTSSKLDKNSPRMASSSSPPTPFAEFFSFPQYSTRTAQSNESMVAAPDNHQWAVADIEVTMVESHANMKILSNRRPRQLLKLVAGLQSLRLSILHLNVTTVDEMVLYSLSVKVEEGCLLGTVDEIAAGVNRLLHTIEEEATGCACLY